MLRKLILLILLVPLNFILLSQEKEGSKYIPDFLKSVEPYGTFQYALGGNDLGWGVVDIIPRVGLKGEWSFDENDKYYFFTTAELGLKLTNRNDFIVVSADPGAGYGQVNNVLFAREGFIGVGTPFGSISIGKQWGVHYTLAGNIDNMYLFGGMAIGVYNAGTDGGTSGTGRADQAVKYEFTKGGFYFGAQVQFRNISDNDNKYADTYGTAIFYEFKGFMFGVSYNKVLDGVDEPDMQEAKINDEYFGVLLDFHASNFHFGILSQVFNNHEKTDIDIFYKGWGFETNLKYNFGKNKKWSFVHNISLLMPFEDENTDYYWNTFDFEIARRFSKNTVAILGFRYDNNNLSNGEKQGLHTMALGFYYNFNYPVP